MTQPAPPGAAPRRPRRVRTPATVRAATRSWLASAAAGLLAAAAALVGRDDQRELLLAEVLAQDPTTDAALAASVVEGALAASAAAVVVLALGEALLAVLVRRRRPVARVLLVVVAVLHLAAAVPLAGFLAEPGWGPGSLVRWALTAELALGLAGLVGVLLPPTSAWLRRR